MQVATIEGIWVKGQTCGRRKMSFKLRIKRIKVNLSPLCADYMSLKACLTTVIRLNEFEPLYYKWQSEANQQRVVMEIK